MAASNAVPTSGSDASVISTSTSSAKSMPRTDAERRTSAVGSPRARTRLHTTSSRLRGTAWSRILAGEADLTVLDGQQLGLPQVADELHRVERVAGGLVVQLRQHVRAGLLAGAGDGPDHAGQLGVVEAGQRDPPASAPVEVGERRPELGGRLRRGVAVAGDDEHGRVDQGPAEVSEQEQRGGLGPVEVVEDQGQRAARRDPAEEVGDRLEQLVALGGVVAGERRRRPEAVRQARGDALELAPAPLAVLLEHARAARARPASARMLRNGSSGTAAPSAQRPNATTLPPCWCWARANAASNVVLPIPASPPSSAVRIEPDRAATRSDSSQVISRCRPMRAGASANSPGSGTSTTGDLPGPPSGRARCRDRRDRRADPPAATRRSIERTSADGSVPVSSARKVRYAW